MSVATVSANRDPFVRDVAEAIMADGEGGASVVLISGPPGFGKTSILTAAASLAAQSISAAVAWVSGGVVASESHLARLLSAALGGEPPESTVDTSLDSVCDRLGHSGQPVILAIDDFDALVFKRERVTDRFAGLIATSPIVRLMATCHPAAGDRLAAPGHRFADAINAAGGRVHSVTIRPLNDQSAHALVRRRAPRLSPVVAQEIIDAAAGHPAALVFLSRLAELRALSIANVSGSRGVGELIEHAAEFAGAVYSESWADLGPQQRAILWQLGAAGVPTTASAIADSIELPASHVSAQLTRLVADGLVRRTGTRGQFALAPLLARWISRRAARELKGTPRQVRSRGARGRGQQSFEHEVEQRAVAYEPILRVSQRRTRLAKVRRPAQPHIGANAPSDQPNDNRRRRVTD